MITTRHIIILTLLLAYALSFGQQRMAGRTGVMDSEQEEIRVNRDDFIYDVELLPGQEFWGYIYHWSDDGDAWGELHEDPEVDWLEITPSSFVAHGCEKPVPVKFTFKAPMQPGTYSTTVEDWEYSWPDNKITLTVTHHPTQKLTDSILVVFGPDTSLTFYQQHEYHGIDPSDSWYEQGYCGTSPYVFNALRKVIHTLYPPHPNVSIEPSEFTLKLNDTVTVIKTFSFAETHLDSVYESVVTQWRSYPEYIKWKLVREDLCCPPPEPELELQAFPNPLRSEAVFTIQLPYDSHVKFQLFDLRGRLIETIVDEYLAAANYQFPIDGKLLAEGLYFGRLQTDRQRLVEKLVKVKD